jgi:hypothetical protein
MIFEVDRPWFSVPKDFRPSFVVVDVASGGHGGGGGVGPSGVLPCDMTTVEYEATTARTAPPKEHQDHQWHWLCAERSSGPVFSEWINGQWWSAGESKAISPEEMYRRGWRWLKRAVPPDEEECNAVSDLIAARAAEFRTKAESANIFDSERVKFAFAARELEKLAKEIGEL